MSTRTNRPQRLPTGLLVPVAPAAAGKSTLARRLVAAGFDAADVVSSDLIRGLAAFGGDVTNQDNNAAVFAEVDKQCDIRLRAGRSVYLDATNLDARSRARAVAQAHAHGLPAVALLSRPLGLDELVTRNASRDRNVPDFVLARHHARHAAITVASLYSEGFDLVVEWDDTTAVAPLPSGVDARRVPGPFVIIGDVHGCFETLMALLDRLGFDAELNHPDGLFPVLLGDLTDKGGAQFDDDPSNPERAGSVRVLRWAMRAHRQGKMLCIKGNHERKLSRKVTTGETEGGFGLGGTLRAIRSQPDADQLISELSRFLLRLPTHLILDDRRAGLIAVHGGIKAELVGTNDRKAENFCLYARGGWKSRWDRPETVVFGHVVQSDGPVVFPGADGVGDIYGIDTGGFEGGGITAYLSATATMVTEPTNPAERCSPERLEAHRAEVDALRLART